MEEKYNLPLKYQLAAGEQPFLDHHCLANLEA